MQPSRGMVLVTGAASGIGEACTLALAQAGYQVAAGVRKPADGEQLQMINSNNIIPVLLDVTKEEQIASAVENVEKWTGHNGLAGMVNNAGIAVGGPFEFTPITEWRRQMEVNLIGTVAVTQAFIPLLRKASGRIIFNGSIAGIFAAPFRGPYSASKFALEAVVDILRIELKPWNIRVSMIEAGNVSTPIWKRSLEEFEQVSQEYPPEAFDLYGGIIRAMQKAINSKPKGAPPEAFADLVMHILSTPNPKARYLLGKDARSKALMRKLPDHWVDWLVWRKMPKD
jgi:NAD(P)-dependent dehydrogenase (short-subunit alcohol dehydrogenase family)